MYTREAARTGSAGRTWSDRTGQLSIRTRWWTKDYRTSSCGLLGQHGRAVYSPLKMDLEGALGLPPDGRAPVPIGQVYVQGCPDELFNGLYSLDADACGGKPHFSTGGAQSPTRRHLFCNQAGQWCLKDKFEPSSTAARAFANWTAVPEPVAGESEWRWWAGRWKTVALTVTTGAAATTVAAEASAATALAEALPRNDQPDWGKLSKEIVMLVLHFSTKKASQAMACVNRSWRDAAEERVRRPSVILINPGIQTHGDWIQARRRLHPHSFG